MNAEVFSWHDRKVVRWVGGRSCALSGVCDSCRGRVGVFLYSIHCHHTVCSSASRFARPIYIYVTQSYLPTPPILALKGEGLDHRMYAPARRPMIRI